MLPSISSDAVNKLNIDFSGHSPRNPWGKSVVGSGYRHQRPWASKHSLALIPSELTSRRLGRRWGRHHCVWPSFCPTSITFLCWVTFIALVYSYSCISKYRLGFVKIKSYNNGNIHVDPRRSTNWRKRWQQRTWHLLLHDSDLTESCIPTTGFLLF